MTAGLVLKIITPERIVFQDTVDFVSLLGIAGSLGVLPGHVPLITQLQIAPLYFERGGQRYTVAVMGGLCKVTGHHVTVMTDAAELAEEIDVLRAEQKKKELEVLLKTPAQAPEVGQVELQARLQKTLLRLRMGEGGRFKNSHDVK